MVVVGWHSFLGVGVKFSTFASVEGLTMAPAYYNGLYSPKEPSVVFVERKKKEGDEDVPIDFEPMEIPDQFDASFMLPRGVQPTASAMVDMFLSDRFCDRVVKATNNYAKKNTSKRRFVSVKRKDILNFFGVYQYMGLVRLPSKDDYFENNGNWPIHPLMSGLK